MSLQLQMRARSTFWLKRTIVLPFEDVSAMISSEHFDFDDGRTIALVAVARGPRNRRAPATPDTGR